MLNVKKTLTKILTQITPKTASLQNTTKKAGSLDMSKTGNVVTFTCPGDFVTLPAGNIDYVTIPEEFRPSSPYRYVIQNNNVKYVVMFVNTLGVVNFYNYSAASSGAANGAFSGSWVTN